MKQLVHTRLLTVLAFLLLITSCQTTKVEQTREPLAQNLEQKIQSIQKESKIPGLQVLLTQNQSTLFSYTHGLRAIDKNVTITENEQWHIGSCTKPMTAFLIGMLIDQKKISWKTTLESIVPKKYKLHSSSKQITIEQLLSHSAGLSEVTEPEKGALWETLFTSEKSSREMRSKLVNGILEMPTHFKSGSKHEYSNASYVVLGWITEQFFSDSWENVMSHHLFKKLDMKSCGFGPAGVENVNLPTQPWSHLFENDALTSVAPGIKADNPPALGPAGTVHCSAQDWRKFLDLFVDEKKALKLISKPTYYKLLSKSDNDSPYTFSSIGRKEKDWSKGTVFAMAGSNTMNYAIVAVAPNTKRIYTINANAGHEKAEAGITQILKLLTEIQ